MLEIPPPGIPIEKRTRIALDKGLIMPHRANDELTAQACVVFYDICGRFPIEEDASRAIKMHREYGTCAAMALPLSSIGPLGAANALLDLKWRADLLFAAHMEACGIPLLAGYKQSVHQGGGPPNFPSQRDSQTRDSGTPDRISRLFDSFDPDKTGLVEREELMKALGKQGSTRRSPRSSLSRSRNRDGSSSRARSRSRSEGGRVRELAEDPRVARVRAVSAAIMVAGDRINAHDRLTASEMLTFLKDTQFAGFTSWMLAGRPRRFNRYDSDGDGAIQNEELERAVSHFLDEEGDPFVVDYSHIEHGAKKTQATYTRNSKRWNY